MSHNGPLPSGWTGGISKNNFLYRNDGNSNAWLKVKLVGTQSNRSGIGAKVRVTAKIGSGSIRQLRQISGGTSGQSTLLAHFGLGNATNVEVLRIEWPSGTVQELLNVAPKQFLTLTEPPKLQTATRQPDGTFNITLRAGIGFSYALDSSENLKNWLPLQTNTATGTTLELNDIDAAKFRHRFYRARLAPSP